MDGYQRRDYSSDNRYTRRAPLEEGYGDGGGQPRGYRPSTAPPRGQMVSPWESGVVPGGGMMRGSGGGQTHRGGHGYMQHHDTRFNQLGQMGNAKSELALNILNAVLSTRTQSGVDSVHHGQARGGDHRPSKMRRLDWGEGYEGEQHGWMGPPVMQQGGRKLPGRSWGEDPRSSWGYSHNTLPHDRKKLKSITKSGNKPYQKKKKANTAGPAGKAAVPGKTPVKDQKKKTDEGDTATGKTPVKDQNKKSDEGEGGSGDSTSKVEKKSEDGTEGTTTDSQADTKKEDNTDTKQSEGTDTDKKESTDDGEKENVKKSENTAGEKQTTDNKVTEADKKAEKKDPMEELPLEALICHICKKNFKTPNPRRLAVGQTGRTASLKGYQNHLKGKYHERLTKVHMEKRNSMFSVLKAQSMLASQQLIVSLHGTKGKIFACNKCACPIKGGMNGMASHFTLRQHALVVNFNKCSICKVKFDCRLSLENHYLTLQHLQNQHDFEKRIKERNVKNRTQVLNKEYDFPEMESLKKVHDQVEELRMDNICSQAWYSGMIPAYDPSVPIGMNYIEKNPQFYCTICSKKTLHTAYGALTHFRTEKHYNNYLQYLKNLEGKGKKDGEEESQADKDAGEAEDEKDTSIEMATLTEALEEVGDNLCELSEDMIKTLASPQHQSQQDKEHSDSFEVEASAASTPAKSNLQQAEDEADTSSQVEQESDTLLADHDTDMQASADKEADTVPADKEADTVPADQETDTVPADKETDTVSADKEMDTASQADQETDTGADADQETDTGADADQEADTGADADQEADTGADADKETEIKLISIKEVTRTSSRTQRVATTSDANDTASTTSTIEETGEEVADTPRRTSRATRGRGRGRGQGGKFTAAKK